jgi:hypothetical protein
MEPLQESAFDSIIRKRSRRMLKRRWMYISLVCLTLSGCAGKWNVIMPYHPGENLKLSYSLSASQSVEVSDAVLETMRTQLDRRLSARNLLGVQGESGFTKAKAEILISGYRMRHGAARALVGIMAGCDRIQSKVTVKESSIGTTIGIASFESTECSAVIPAQKTINGHIENIVDYLSGGDRND